MAVKILCDTANLLGAAMLSVMPFLTEAELAALPARTGYDGWCWTPFRTLRFGGKHWDVTSPALLATIRCFCQSFRNERSLRDVVRHEHKKRALGAYLALPHTLDSLAVIDRLQLLLPESVPVIYDPSRPGFPASAPAYGAHYLTSPDLLASWQPESIADLIAMGERGGFAGPAVDPCHLLAQSQLNRSNALSTLLRQFGDSMQLFILSLGRTDIRPNDSMSRDKLRDLTLGTGSSGVLRELSDLIRRYPTIMIVVRAPVDAVCDVMRTFQLNCWDGRQPLDAWIDAHQQIVQQIREVERFLNHFNR